MNRMSVRVSDEMDIELGHLAVDRRTTKNALVVEAVRDFMDKERRSKVKTIQAPYGGGARQESGLTVTEAQEFKETVTEAAAVSDDDWKEKMRKNGLVK